MSSRAGYPDRAVPERPPTVSLYAATRRSIRVRCTAGSRTGAGLSSGHAARCSTACPGCNGTAARRCCSTWARALLHLRAGAASRRTSSTWPACSSSRAYSLFLFTAVAGRLWCGFACPQTVYTEIFMWVERRFEGDRSARIKLDRRHGRRASSAQAAASMLVWVTIGAVDRLHLRRLLHADPCAAAASAALLARPVGMVLGPLLRLRHLRQRRLHARAGVQVHVPVCALPELDVRPRHADRQLRRAARRAARLARPRRRAGAIGKGDCIDCTLCVQVCPTGIDIRNGLQYECIGCAACVDACNGVMDKIS